MKRYLAPSIQSLLGEKILLLSGPRQVGKTYLAKSLASHPAYYNYDIKKDLQVFHEQNFDSKAPLVIFDELHKMKKWKLWLKGLYDSGRFQKQSILVTGSARLDALKKVGDSLAGRYFHLRLHPLDLKELSGTESVEKIYDKILTRGGFPEPYLSKEVNFHRLWRKSHSDIILKQDLFSLEVVKDLDSLELLVELLANRVGSTISVNALSEDLQVSDKTITRWLKILEDLYIVFCVTPYAKNIARALRKTSKYYFYDIGRIEGDESQKLENLVALSLKKELDFLSDTKGLKTRIHFLKNREHKEIDFYLQIENNSDYLIEVKLSDAAVSKNFVVFNKFFPKAKKLQWVKNLDRNYNSKDGVRVEYVLEALQKLHLNRL